LKSRPIINYCFTAPIIIVSFRDSGILHKKAARLADSVDFFGHNYSITNLGTFIIEHFKGEIFHFFGFFNNKKSHKAIADQK